VSRKHLMNLLQQETGLSKKTLRKLERTTMDPEIPLSVRETALKAMLPPQLPKEMLARIKAMVLPQLRP